MFFYISKILSFLIYPGYWLLAGFLVAYFTKNKRRKKVFTIITLSLTFLLTNFYVYQKVFNWWQTPHVNMPLGKHYDAGILLGGMYSFDKDNRGYFNGCSDRFIEINKLYHTRVIRKIIISGGSASILIKQPAEADSLINEFVQSGVKTEDIVVEGHSRNTYENALYTKKLCDSLKLKPPYMLVTSAFHMPRAMKVFKKQNIDIIPYPSNYLTVPVQLTPDMYILPNFGLLNDWGTLIKEWIGIMAYTITGKA